MKAIDVAAWGDALGVRPKELVWALTSRIRQVEEQYDALTRLRASLAGAPDEELLMTLTSACRSLAVAGDTLTETLGDFRKGD